MPSRKDRRKQTTPGKQTTPDDWVSRVRESSHDVVLAGLASLARTRGAECGPAHADFRSLVAEGRRLEPELHEAARRVWNQWIAEPGKAMALPSRGRLQGVFDERVGSALARLGVPSREEFDELLAKVDRLLERDDGTHAPSTPRRASGRVRTPAPKRRRTR